MSASAARSASGIRSIRARRTSAEGSSQRGSVLGSSFKDGPINLGDDQKLKLREEDEWFGRDPFADPKEDAVK